MHQRSRKDFGVVFESSHEKQLSNCFDIHSIEGFILS